MKYSEEAVQLSKDDWFSCMALYNIGYYVYLIDIETFPW